MKNGHSGWTLYGAYGTTGELILEEALRRGHRPLLAGRNPSRLSDLASKKGLDAVAFGVESAVQALPALEGVSLVLNAAGPFFETGGPLRRLCLETRASYVDVNGEIGDFVAATGCDAEARERRVAIIPGAGYGVVFAEAVAARVASRLADASWLRLSLATENALTSRGASLSKASVLSGGGYVVSRGELRARPTAHQTWRVAEQRFAAAPLAEVVAAHRLTGIKEVVAGIPLPLAAAIALRWAGRLVGASRTYIEAKVMAKTMTTRITSRSTVCIGFMTATLHQGSGNTVRGAGPPPARAGGAGGGATTDPHCNTEVGGVKVAPDQPRARVRGRPLARARGW